MAGESTRQSRHHTVDKPIGWQERSVEWLSLPLGRFLDYGCGPCGLLEKLSERCDECHGVDVDADKIRAAQERYPEFKLGVIDPDGRTDYPDNYFVAIVEVIEHVPDERRTLTELARILKPGAGYCLPRHTGGGLPSSIRGTSSSFSRGYIASFTPRCGTPLPTTTSDSHVQRRMGWWATYPLRLIADPGTRHYTPEEIAAACPPSLILEKSAVYFPGMRAMMFLQAALSTCSGGRWNDLPAPLRALSTRLSLVTSATGDQLVLLFTKRP